MKQTQQEHIDEFKQENDLTPLTESKRSYSCIQNLNKFQSKPIQNSNSFCNPRLRPQSASNQRTQNQTQCNFPQSVKQQIINDKGQQFNNNFITTNFDNIFYNQNLIDPNINNKEQFINQIDNQNEISNYEQNVMLDKNKENFNNKTIKIDKLIQQLPKNNLFEINQNIVQRAYTSKQTQNSFNIFHQYYPKTAKQQQIKNQLSFINKQNDTQIKEQCKQNFDLGKKIKTEGDIQQNYKINNEKNHLEKQQEIRNLIKQSLLEQNLKQNQLFLITDNFTNVESIDKTTLFKENFIVGKQIGKGAYACVRLSLHKPTNTKVAIKSYEKEKIKDSQRKKSILREIKLLQSMNHPFIVQIYDTIETNHHVNIIMEYIQGKSLLQFLKEQPQRKISESQAKSIFYKIVDAIQYCHNQSITHRDIKLENILLDNQSNPKLIDFGFSTCIPNTQKVKMFCGTPSYMSPQIINKQEYYGPPADCWALGILLYVLLHGQFPFKGANDEELYSKINKTQFQLNNSLSNNVKELIKQILVFEEEKRLNCQQVLFLIFINIAIIYKILMHKWFSESEESQKKSPNLEENINFQRALSFILKNKNNQIADQQLQNAKQEKKQNVFQQWLKEKSKTTIQTENNGKKEMSLKYQFYNFKKRENINKKIFQ